MQIGNSSAKRTHLIAIASGILVIICAAALYILYREPSVQSWNAEYIDSIHINHITDPSHITKLFYVTEFDEGDGAIAIANRSSDDTEEELYIAYLEGEFPKHVNVWSHTITSDELSQKTENGVMYGSDLWYSSYQNQIVVYNVYLSPTRDTLTVNGEEVQVKKIPIELNGQSYTIGFWYKLFPKDTQVTVE